MNGPKNGATRLLDRFKKPQPMAAVAMPKVCLCLPSGDLVHKDFACSLALMMQANGAVSVSEGVDLPLIPAGMCDVRGSLIARNRNQAVAEAIAAGFDYVLFLDSDMQFPPATLRRLLSHEKDIVGVTYVQRDPPHKLLGVWPEGTVLSSDKLHEVDALPGGCILIKLSVFEKMVKPYYRTPAYEADDLGEARIQGEDYYFCEQAKRLGFSVWLDVALSMQVKHVGSVAHGIPVQRQMVMEPEAEALPMVEEVSDGQAAALH